jgi:hypothetical protein
VRRGLVNQETEANFSLHVYTWIRWQFFENLKGTVHDIIVSIIVYDYFSFEISERNSKLIFYRKTCIFGKYFEIGFLNKTEYEYRIL